MQKPERKNTPQIATNLDNFSSNHVVSSMSARDRKILEELVRDCVLYSLHENESLEYIRKRAGGIPISRSNYYSIKKRISQNEISNLEGRLTNHARVGYAFSHFQIFDQIKGIQKICEPKPCWRNLRNLVKGRIYLQYLGCLLTSWTIFRHSGR
jgi:hypothetical protein